jgi:transcriptional regulator GlxA family with amidase domain
LVTARIAAQISLKDLANECRLSASHFAKAFKQTIGEPPHRWLLRQRVKVAKKMLAGSKQSIAEIAIACGFADQSHLTRAFSGIIGVTPGAWRRGNDPLLRAGVANTACSQLSSEGSPSAARHHPKISARSPVRDIA